FDAKVTSAEVTPFKGDPDHPAAVDVTFTVDEGAPRKIESVELDGLDQVKDNETLSRDFTGAVAAGGAVDHQKYLDARRALESALRHRGHAWAEVHGRVVVDRANHAARVLVDVSAGPIARFSQIHVDGLERVGERAVVRHARIRPGDPFT